MKNNNSPKIVIIGIDGATFSLIKPWADAGKLPTLSTLMDKGAWGSAAPYQTLMEDLKTPAVAFQDQETGLGGQLVNIEETLRTLIARFNSKASEDEKLRTELEGMTRKIEVEMRDGESYNFVLENTQLINFSKGRIDEPDIRIISDTKSFEALINREMGPMKALVTGKVRIEASLEDKLRLRKIL